MNRDAHRADTERIAAQAAQWLQAQRHQPGPETDQALMQWLKASPIHVREFMAVSMLEQELPRLACLQALDADALVAQARAQSNVIPMRLPERAHKPTAPAAPKRVVPASMARHAVGWAVAACAVLAVGMSMTWEGAWTPGSNAQRYATLVGEYRNVALADGSLIVLGPRSEVVVRYNDTGRDVQLASGAATFSVAKDPARPFVVHAGNTLVQAVGTQFVVNRLTSGTTVAVTEGRVKVTSAPQPPMERLQAALRYITPGGASPAKKPAAASGAKPAPTTPADTSVGAGEQAAVSPDGASVRREPLDPLQVDGMRQGRLVFRDSTLVDIAEQFNRYNVLPMEVRGERLAAMRFSGVFNANDPTSFLQFLSLNPQIATYRTSERFVIVQRGERP